MNNHNNHKEPANHEGLAKELLTVVNDPKFQSTTDKFVRRNEPLFKILTGVGFAIALASGLFGYLLKANSEADDRKAEALTRVINEKKEWAKRTAEAIIELRALRAQFMLDCELGKPPSTYEHRKLRFAASLKLLGTASGIDEVFDDSVKDSLLEFSKFEESIQDFCAKDAPGEAIWSSYLSSLSQKMGASIQRDRDELDKVATGLLSSAFKKF